MSDYSAHTTDTFNITAGKHIFMVLSSTIDTNGMFLVTCNSAGAVFIQVIAVGSGLTVQASTNTLTVTHASIGLAFLDFVADGNPMTLQK